MEIFTYITIRVQIVLIALSFKATISQPYYLLRFTLNSIQDAYFDVRVVIKIQDI